MAENKVQFGLKNVYYAKITETNGTITYGTPVAVPGGVNLNLSASGEITRFYADNIVYWMTQSNQGYEGDLEVARIPDTMFKDIFGLTEGGTSKVLTENANTELAHFALLFQIDGDQQNDLHVLYNCVPSRPAVASGTIQATKEPVTASFTLSAIPRPEDGKVRARTTDTTPTATRSGWFSSVFVEA